MDLINDFEELKPILQEKWLDFYEKNEFFLKKFDNQKDYSQGDIHFNAERIMLILVVLEPKLGEKMLIFQEIVKYMKIDFPDSVKWLKILNISNKENTLKTQIEERNQKKMSQEKSPLDDFRKPL